MSLVQHAASPTSYKSDTVLVRPHKFPIPKGAPGQKVCMRSSGKKEKRMLQSEMENNQCRTRVMSD